MHPFGQVPGRKQFKAGQGTNACASPEAAERVKQRTLRSVFAEMASCWFATRLRRARDQISHEPYNTTGHVCRNLCQLSTGEAHDVNWTASVNRT